MKFLTIQEVKVSIYWVSILCNSELQRKQIPDRPTPAGRFEELRNVQSAFVHRIVALSVGAALMGVPHCIAYRSVLFEHDLVVHPARSIQVATDRRVRTTRGARPQADERLRPAISRQ